MGNHVHHIPAPAGCTDGNGGSGIDDANYGAQDDDIVGNVVHDIGGGSIGTCVHAVIQGIYHANLRGHIQNNDVYRVAAYGIHLWHAATNVVIANNTVFNNGWFNGAGTIGGGIIVGDGDSPGGVNDDHTTVINNVIYGNGGSGLEEYGAVGTNNHYANNLVRGNRYDVIFLTGTDANRVTADPMFVNYQADGSGDYGLAAASPAVDTGTTTCASGTSSCAPTADLEGGHRPVGSGWDLGAFERGAGSAPWPWY
jgi:parallel beta-helix repeat protein